MSSVKVHSLITQIAEDTNDDTRFVYGKYYKKFQKKYPDVDLKSEKSKLKSIQAADLEEELINIIKEDKPEIYQKVLDRDKQLDLSDKQKIKIMEREINLIGGGERGEDIVESTQNDINDDIKKFVIKALLKVPNYWWNIPASSTGRHHPMFSVQKSGLAKHSKAAVQVAMSLFDVEIFEFNERTRGLIIASIILHDCLKKGEKEEMFTRVDHPVKIVEFLKDKVDCSDISEKELEKICGMILTHMGKFNTPHNSKKEKMPKPSSKIEYFVHICDLISSRKWVDFDFNKDFEV